MKVKELIEKLKQFDPEARVTGPGVLAYVWQVESHHDGLCEYLDGDNWIKSGSGSKVVLTFQSLDDHIFKLIEYSEAARKRLSRDKYKDFICEHFQYDCSHYASRFQGIQHEKEFHQTVSERFDEMLREYDGP